MKDLIEYIAKSIVDNPEEVVVIEEPGEDGIVLRLQVAPDDTGKVIGKEGRIAKAMRTLLRVAAIRKGTRASLEIISDHEPPRSSYGSSGDTGSRSDSDRGYGSSGDAGPRSDSGPSSEPDSARGYGSSSEPDSADDSSPSSEPDSDSDFSPSSEPESDSDSSPSSEPDSDRTY